MGQLVAKKPDIDTTAEAAVDVDAPPPPCPHPAHRLGTHGSLRKHQRVCCQCGKVVLVSKRARMNP